MFKKKKGGAKNRAVSKRNHSSDDDDCNSEDDTSAILSMLKQEVQQGKRLKLNPTAFCPDTSNNNNNNNNPKPNIMHSFESTTTKESLTQFNDATKLSEYDTAHTNDARAKLEKKAADPNDSGGLRNKQSGTKGPIRAPTFVRTTCQFDYQPDVCKDYKMTGFCGFGDTCIFLHDRGDYSKGWEAENEWDAKKKRDDLLVQEGMKGSVFEEGGEGGTGAGAGADVDADENRRQIATDGIPFACLICQGPFKEPVVTICAHYFCDRCIRKHHKVVGGKCPVCAKETHGTFNYPSQLHKKMKTMKITTLEDFFAKKCT